MTRETIIALTTTIESREWMRRRCANEGLPLEHARATSTDDVECFFSVLRKIIGNHFTSKSVMLQWRKICLEFSKRIDVNLPFFYYTSTHDRFYEGERPSFDKYIKPTTSNPRHQRVRTREQPGNLAVGRATLIKTGAKSIHREYHNLPLELPPAPGAPLEQLNTHINENLLTQQTVLPLWLPPSFHSTLRTVPSSIYCPPYAYYCQLSTCYIHPSYHKNVIMSFSVCIIN